VLYLVYDMLLPVFTQRCPGGSQGGLYTKAGPEPRANAEENSKYLKPCYLSFDFPSSEKTSFVARADGLLTRVEGNGRLP
jgi:hypothetical protein